MFFLSRFSLNLFWNLAPLNSQYCHYFLLRSLLPEVSENKKQELKEIYLSLNPAQLKRTIDKKLDLLYKAYQKKNKSPKVEPLKKLNSNSPTFYLRQPKAVHLPS